jgi:phage head maturation protease
MLLRHSYAVDDATVGAGRTLDMTLVPIDSPRYVVDDAGPYREEWTVRSFAHVDPTRVKLQYTHYADLPLGLGVAGTLRHDGHYWRASMRVATGERGDHTVDLVRDGVLRSVSVGFAPGVDDERVDADGPIVVRTKVKRLDHVALVDPADVAQYDDAEVVAVRSREEADRAQLHDWINKQRRKLNGMR